MAATMVERLTGQTAPADVNVEVQIMMPLEALLDPTSARPATIPGYGPPPGDVARDIVITSMGRNWWRRLFTAPKNGPIVAGDPSRRCFTGWLADLIKLRDQTCRNPFCGALIRHIDHIARHADDGPTSYSNGRGACQRCNYARETPGWHITVINAGVLDKPTASASPHPLATTTSAEPRPGLGDGAREVRPSLRPMQIRPMV
jgi:hypothetical protein